MQRPLVFSRPAPQGPIADGAALRAAQVFWHSAKTLAQGQFICPELVKALRGPRGKPRAFHGTLGDAAQYLGADAFFNLK